MPVKKKFMPTQIPAILDKEIIALLSKKNDTAWKLLYEKYAPMMYGIILEMTGNAEMAEKILNETFRELKEKKKLLQVHTAICHRLLMHAYRMALRHLTAHDLSPVKCDQRNKKYPLTKLLCFEGATLKDAAASSGLDESEAFKKLQTELSTMHAHFVQRVTAPEFSMIRF